ncbi:MAG: hypothetical protein H3C53_12365, partial [Trueperaceae bacterium]|nr:hypothetical protein [Trueperaceae bacterium]
VSLVYFDVLVDPRNGDVYVVGDDPTIHHAVSHDGGATFSDYTRVDEAYAVYYSDYSIGQLGRIVVAGGGMDLETSVWNVDADAWSRGPGGQPVESERASAAIDAADHIHVISVAMGAVTLSSSTDSGATYSSVPVASGSEADIAPSTFVVGAPVIYNDEGVIRYAFVPNPPALAPR